MDSSAGLEPVYGALLSTESTVKDSRVLGLCIVMLSDEINCSS